MNGVLQDFWRSAQRQRNTIIASEYRVKIYLYVVFKFWTLESISRNRYRTYCVNRLQGVNPVKILSFYGIVGFQPDIAPYRQFRWGLLETIEN